MRKTILTALFGLIALPILAQNFQISGTVRDAATQNVLAGASVLVENSFIGTATNAEGIYVLKRLPAGTYKLRVQYLGYKLVVQEVKLQGDQQLDFQLEVQRLLTDEVVVSATRATSVTPMAVTNVSKAELAKQNLGQDLPFLLQFTPSVVVNSDAGAGVGYTGIRIRGSDGTRINVTMNGIPVNDAESHGVFWVNMPDFASSVDNIQIQRGVGTSTNGAAAFGGSINIQTNQLIDTAYANLGLTYGSFNTWRQNATFGTGLLENGWAFDGRLSSITSDGYVDRASSDLKGYAFSGSRYGKKSILRFNIFSGREKTYQAWNGLPQNMLETNRRFNSAGQYTDPNGQIQFYENETDNYQQDHYQFFYTYEPNKNWSLNSTLFYTYGRGYYEQFRNNERFSRYQLPNLVIGGETISRTDFIRQRWLDNHFYGAILSANYKKNKLNANFGAAANQYDGDHFGDVIWARLLGNNDIKHRYYENNALKTEFNFFAKAEYELLKGLFAYGDLQFRSINYRFEGFNNQLINVTQTANFNFFNPKAGAYYQLNQASQVYASVAVGNREPVRADLVESSPQSRPTAERMIDYEAGFKRQGKRSAFAANLFYMDYFNQLVLNGQINDVGGYIRTNVDRSYRAGIELEYGISITKWLQWSANLTLSDNRILVYNEFVDLYDENFDYLGNGLNRTYNNTPIAFSPGVIGASILSFKPAKGLGIDLMSKYVGRQYLDNSGDASRSLDPYLVHDLRVNYTVNGGKMAKQVVFGLLVNNLGNLMYSANGYTYPYVFDGAFVADNFVYPQAGTNFLANIQFRF
ncbi:MAG: TonB-dependent receptor [Sphingobacteriaceae bacterium]|nr:TonB-dependent receptor [Sphingobacteriaceae bacterium]